LALMTSHISFPIVGEKVTNVERPASRFAVDESPDFNDFSSNLAGPINCYRFFDDLLAMF